MTNQATPPGAGELIIAPSLSDYPELCSPTKSCQNWDRELLKVEGLQPDEPLALFVFRSIIKQRTDQDKLDVLDEQAHLAATRAKGFRHYEVGPANEETGFALSWCGWDTPPDARASMTGVEHREAAQFADEAYKVYRLTGHIVTLGAGGEVEFSTPPIRDSWGPR